MNKWMAAMGLVALVAGCGGGGTSAVDQIDVLRAQALAKETEAKALAVDQPCLTDSQCKVLDFSPSDANCTTISTKAYSSISPTASQAEAAAAEQRAFASQARSLLPPGSTVCPMIARAPARCEAGKCVTP